MGGMPCHKFYDRFALQDKIKLILSNKRSFLKRQGKHELEQQAQGIPPKSHPHTAHKHEWKAARAGEPSKQHTEVRRIQMEHHGSSHFGLGDIASWHAEFVSIAFIRRL